MIQRHEFLSALSHNEPWDVVIIGGGATGLGCAVDATTRGYRTLLVEQHDFAKGTSSRSTKLIHGGVRYLRQGNLNLVRHALKERERLLRNAAHLVWPRSFIVPAYAWGERSWYALGLKLYDYLAGSLGMGKARVLTRQQVLENVPTLNPEGLRGGVLYFDGQFDDARLAVCLARTAAVHGATVLNYMRAAALWKENGKLRGVHLEDRETGTAYQVAARAIISATGIFADEIRSLDHVDGRPLLAFSQGAHIVVERFFLPGDSGFMIPKTSDGRVLFAIPWHDRVVLGTTDLRVSEAVLEPVPRSEELMFLLDHAARYLARPPTATDILSTYAGIRPLVMRSSSLRTAALPRDHWIGVSDSGLITITGGKWTTYRQMAEETIDRAMRVGDLPPKTCVTAELKLQGAPVNAKGSSKGHDHAMHYGTELEAAWDLTTSELNWQAPLHPRLPYRQLDVVWSVREEFARTVEDVLARRTRSLLLDAQASSEVAPAVAALMAAELDYGPAWIESQVQEFRSLAQQYLPSKLD